jgi:hypothetical protein
MITGAQVRAAKALLDWSGTRLAEEANVAISTIRRVEACDGLLATASVKVLQSIKAALECGGIEFIGTPDDRPGVRFNKPQK